MSYDLGKGETHKVEFRIRNFKKYEHSQSFALIKIIVLGIEIDIFLL